MSLEDVVAAVRMVQPYVLAYRRRGNDSYARRVPANNHETSTRYIVIDPVLRSLGWDLGNPGHCIVEYDTRPKSGRNDWARHRFVDYALLNSKGSPVVVVEAKRIGVNTGEDEGLGQISAYVKSVRTARVAVLTNGQYWDIELKKSGKWEAEDPKRALGLLWDNVGETAERLYKSLDRSRFVEPVG